MNQLIRQIRQAHCKQAQGERGFSQVILLGIITVFILVGSGGFLVLREKKMPSRELASTPQFIQTDFIDLSKISSISKFRSGSGHDFSRGSGETCRSMKHYFNVWRTKEADRLVNQNKGIPPPPEGKTDIPIYSPVDGKIINIESEQVPIGQQIYIQPDLYPNFTVRLFHIYPLSDIKKSVSVKAGQKIGVIGRYQNTDIAIMQGRAMYISYFNVMPDDLFAKYQALGVNSREELIISKEERDANPLECNGEWFVKNYDGDPNFENFVYLEDVTSPIEPTPSPVQSIQPPQPKPQPELKPTALPPSPAKAIIEEDKPSILKNLSINMGPWDRQTNRAGDIVFSKNLLFDDGFINNETAFLGFGEFEHMINNPDRSVEYWWFLVPGTKVRAPVDGVVSVGFIEHTKDWGVNIAKGWTSWKAPIGSKWIIGQEHLVNLVVQDGDIVKAGDILGEAAPRQFPGEDFGFVELSVWTGGREGIFKYCPFDFLDESLKPMYKEKINQLAKDWEEFIGKDVYKQEEWVAPGCVLHEIKEQ